MTSCETTTIQVRSGCYDTRPNERLRHSWNDKLFELAAKGLPKWDGHSGPIRGSASVRHEWTHCQLSVRFNSEYFVSVTKINYGKNLWARYEITSFSRCSSLTTRFRVLVTPVVAVAVSVALPHLPDALAAAHAFKLVRPALCKREKRHIIAQSVTVTEETMQDLFNRDLQKIVCLPQPSSSEPSMQSRSPSHTREAGMTVPTCLHSNQALPAQL